MSQHLFNIVPQSSASRTKFDRSHYVLTTMDENYLIPIEIDEIVPSDTVICKPSVFGRLSTLIAPIFSRVYIDLFAFYVPERLCFSRFEEMLGDLPVGQVESDLTFPTLQTGTSGQKVESNSIFDYVGFPVNSTFYSNDNLRAEPFIAYNMIYNEWFRDENLCPLVPYNPQQAVHDVSDFKLMKRGKLKDYFTGALPWPQKGPNVSLGLAGSAPIRYSTESISGKSLNQYFTSSMNGVGLFGTATTSSSGTVSAPSPVNYTNNTFSTSLSVDSPTSSKVNLNAYGVDYVLPTGSTTPSGIVVDHYSYPLISDLSVATGIDVDSFNKAWKLQRFYQRLALGGSRYVEILRSMFGVTGVDARLQRPELLYSHTYEIDVSAVPQTSATSSESPQGNLAAYSVGYDDGIKFSKSFPEHGWIVYIANLRSDLTYSQGIERQFLRRTKFDMLWPSFATLGEQPIENRELYFQGNGNSDDTDVFGYQERYAEYRYKQNRISGKFSPTDSQSLSFWHLSQKFGSLPKLNSEFIEQDFPFERVEAVTSEPTALVKFDFDLQHIRPLPLYGTPALDTHF